MHGGMSTGAPKGNKNAWKHGREYCEARSLIKAQTGLSTRQIPEDMVRAKMLNLELKRYIWSAKKERTSAFVGAQP